MSTWFYLLHLAVNGNIRPFNFFCSSQLPQKMMLTDENAFLFRLTGKSNVLSKIRYLKLMVFWSRVM